MTKKSVKNAGAIVLALLIAGCASDTRSGQGKGSQSTRPSQEAPAERQDQRQEEQRKQDRQQHEMERGELGATKPVFPVT
jgi:PBP1b-binding outer membrane lipoprotein LpoB